MGGRKDTYLHTLLEMGGGEAFYKCFSLVRSTSVGRETVRVSRRRVERLPRNLFFYCTDDSIVRPTFLAARLHYGNRLTMGSAPSNCNRVST